MYHPPNFLILFLDFWTIGFPPCFSMKKCPFGAMGVNLRKLIHLRSLFLKPFFPNPSHDGLTYIPEWCVVVGLVSCPAPHGSSLPHSLGSNGKAPGSDTVSPIFSTIVGRTCSHLNSNSRCAAMKSLASSHHSREPFFIPLPLTHSSNNTHNTYSTHSFNKCFSKGGGGAGQPVQCNEFPQSFSTPVANVCVQLSGWIAFVHRGLGG